MLGHYSAGFTLDTYAHVTTQAQRQAANTEATGMKNEVTTMFSKVFTLTNQKGGVGKTSSALNLGAALSISGKKVLIIDNDPQGNLTAALGYTPAEQSRTLSNLLLAAIDYPEDLELHFDRTVIHTDKGTTPGHWWPSSSASPNTRSERPSS